MANKLVKFINSKKHAFDSKGAELKGVSITNIPFFDIDYRTMLRIMTKSLDSNPKDADSLSSNKELHIMHQNMHLLERLFGFKFQDNYSLNLINNQSYITLDRIYPEITDVIEDEKHGLLSEEQLSPNTARPSTFHIKKQTRNKDFHILTENSLIINHSQSFKVS